MHLKETFWLLREKENSPSLSGWLQKKEEYDWPYHGKFFRCQKSMWHEGLLLKIRKFDIPKTFTRRIANILQDRKAHYRVGDTLSRPLNITKRTLQGSTISPILFIMYICCWHTTITGQKVDLLGTLPVPLTRQENHGTQPRQITNTLHEDHWCA